MKSGKWGEKGGVVDFTGLSRPGPYQSADIACGGQCGS